MATIDIALPALEGHLRSLRPTEPATCEGRCTQQVRTLGQYALVTLVLAPAPDQDGLSLIDDCRAVEQSGSYYQGDGIEFFHRGIARGIADVLEHYRDLGFDITGLRITIYRMVVHPIDSTEGAFRVAARNAFASCLLSAGLAT